MPSHNFEASFPAGPSSNSASCPTFVDLTSTSSATPLVETTAPSGNLASIMQNWTVVFQTVVSRPLAQTRPDSKDLSKA